MSKYLAKLKGIGFRFIAPHGGFTPSSSKPCPEFVFNKSGNTNITEPKGTEPAVFFVCSDGMSEFELEVSKESAIKGLPDLNHGWWTPFEIIASIPNFLFHPLTSNIKTSWVGYIDYIRGHRGSIRCTKRTHKEATAEFADC